MKDRKLRVFLGVQEKGGQLTASIGGQLKTFDNIIPLINQVNAHERRIRHNEIGYAFLLKQIRTLRLKMHPSHRKSIKKGHKYGKAA